MGCYHVWLSKYSSTLNTIFLPPVKYHFKILTIGAINSPDVFQYKTNDVLRGFEFIHEYKYDNLVLTEGYWKYHFEKLELTLTRMKENILKYNIKSIPLVRPKWNIWVSG